LGVILVQSFQDFIALLEKKFPEGSMGLLFIPGTTLRSSQSSYDLDQISKFFSIIVWHATLLGFDK
jgi:hypothetical protein